LDGMSLGRFAPYQLSVEGPNKNKLAGRDTEPNLSRSGIRPAIYSALRTGSVEAAVFVGGVRSLGTWPGCLQTHKGRLEADERKC
jgi:hypothetical protein